MQVSDELKQRMNHLKRSIEQEKQAQTKRTNTFNIQKQKLETEVVQCLHHSTTCDLNCVLLLIGDHSGLMLVGTLLKYDAMIKAARQRF